MRRTRTPGCAQLVDYQGPTPEAWWQATLDAIAPPGGRLTWLKLVWVPGDPWRVEDPDADPRMGAKTLDGSVNRWIIHTMFPLDRTPAHIRDDLMGPSPRDRGHFDRVLGRFIPDPKCNVSLQQWQLFRDTRCWAKPYWIVQGTGGGHKKSWKRVESVISRMHGGPKDPPLPGALPFANPDNRTFDKLVKLDLVRKYSYLVDRAGKSKALMDAHDTRIIEEMKDQVWRWMRDGIRDVLSEERAGSRAIWESGRNTNYNEAAIEKALADN